MTRLIKKILIIVVILSNSCLLAAQETENDPKWNPDGEIDAAQFIIDKNKPLELPKANRFFKPIKEEKSEIGSGSISYRVKSFDFTPNVKLPNIKLQKIPKQPITKLYGNKITLGYGNFSSPYVDLALASKRDKLYSYGLNFNHYSFGKGAVDDENSAFGNTDVEVFGKIFGKKTTSYASIGYKNAINHFYGYQLSDTPPNQDSIRQQFDRFNVNLGFFGTNQNSPLRYQIETGFASFKNTFQASENNFNLDGGFSYKLDEESVIGLEVEGTLSQYEDSTSINRNLLLFKPTYERKISGVYLTLGFQVALDNDTLSTNKKSSVFPHVHVRFPISETFDVYGGITGGKSFTSFNNLSSENPWVGPRQALVNASNKLEFYGGVNGKVNDKISASVSFSAGSINNQSFFANGLNDSTRFDILYDNVSVFKFSASVAYSFFEKASVQLESNFYGYDTDVLAEAWHKPTLEFDITAKYNIFDKVILSPSFNILSGIEGINLQTGEQETLEATVLLNLQSKYILSDRAGIYLNLNNIIGENYERYLNYQGRGLQVSAGFTYSF